MKKILPLIFFLPFSVNAQYFSIHQLIDFKNEPFEYLSSTASEMGWKLQNESQGDETTLDNINYVYHYNEDTKKAEGVLNYYYSRRTSRVVYEVHDKKVYNSLMRELSFLGFVKQQAELSSDYTKQSFGSLNYTVITEKVAVPGTKNFSYFFTLLSTDDYNALISNKTKFSLASNK